MMKAIIAILAWFVVASMADEQPDYDREQRIADQIEPQIFDGEGIWLSDNEREFLSIYLPADNAKGSVIVLHGRDVNPEDLNVAGPLRVGLAENGWTTLAIQLPVLEKGKTYYDYLPILPFAHGRIEAAIAFLKAQGSKPIILAGHSCGAHMANNWLNKKGENMIDGYVAISSGATDAGQDLKTPLPFGNMRVPVLDIYGELEFPRALDMLDQRRSLIQQNSNAFSTMVAVEQADHYFKEQGEALSMAVLQWLNTTKF